MPLLIRHNSAIQGEQAMPVAPPADALKIALINNMPDPALEATERQFAGCLAAAAASQVVMLDVYLLPSLARGALGEQYRLARCGDYRSLFDEACDAIIITGTEPRAADLADEPYWQSLTALFDWAAENTRSIFLSCLSAHAWLQHRNGIRRRRLPAKCCGIFAHDRVAPDGGFACGLSDRILLPHSRWNDLNVSELEQAGYRPVYASKAAGVGVFLQQADSLFLCCQGHPEYDPASLAKEYRRDVGRYLRRESEIYPALPVGLFGAETIEQLGRFRAEAIADRRHERLDLLPILLPELPGGSSWQPHAVQLFERWLAFASRARERAIPAAGPVAQPASASGFVA
jgi:homoserine O-succinyltransferase